MEAGKAVVLYDGSCGVCAWLRRAAERLDWLRRIRWVAYQSPEAERFGIPVEQMERGIQLIARGQRWSGFAAVQQLALRLPALYGVAFALAWRRPRLGIAVAAALSPVARPIGNPLYRFVSAHRHTFSPRSCRFRSQAGRVLG